MKFFSQFNNSYNEIKDKILKKCPKCEKSPPGYLYYDYHSIELFVIYCTECKFREKVIRDAINIEINKEGKKCSNERCAALIVTVDVENPFLNGDTCYTGCIFCDETIR